MSSIPSEPPFTALQSLGQPVPDASHAVSVSLPSWRSNIAYEEGERWVIDRMRNGYPRFFINEHITAFQEDILSSCGSEREGVLLFPSVDIATRCLEFISRFSDVCESADLLPTRVFELAPKPSSSLTTQSPKSYAVLSATVFDARNTGVARKFWQHTGEGISSRRAEFFHRQFRDGEIIAAEIERPNLTAETTLVKGPRRYRKEGRQSIDNVDALISNDDGSGDVSRRDIEHLRFVEERYGRNLDISLASKAKTAVRRRIAGSINRDMTEGAIIADTDDVSSARSQFGCTENHVYLFPTGMSAIYNSHRFISILRSQGTSVMFGFPYTDTLKVLEKFGAGALFYGNGSAADLDDLEERCARGEKFQALYCEFPGNPLLKTPDLKRIRSLADKYGFVVVVDETIGNFLNVNVLPAADIVVSSLTKIFSGDANVMGGSLVVNPKSKFATGLLQTIQSQYRDNLWLEDAIFLERNSRDFIARNGRVNHNAQAIAKLLAASDKVKSVYYPELAESKVHYDEFRNADGGYSGLLSATFHSHDDAVAFYDSLAIAKGPSLGTNFTLASPFVILAHYHELDWARQFGVDSDLVRFSVGIEPTSELLNVFKTALEAIATTEARGEQITQ